MLNYFLRIRKSIVPLISIVLAAGSLSAVAQVAPSAYDRKYSITVGGTASAFQPDYAGNETSQAGPYRLFGVGTYVDVKFSRWIQIEGEARWLRFNQFEQIYQDNYLIGPRIPIHYFHSLRSTVYGKALIGNAYMGVPYNLTSGGYIYSTGKFTDIAFGGGVDVRLNKRFSIRAFDFEYQDYPKFIFNHSLRPYGASVGIGYKIF